MCMPGCVGDFACVLSKKFFWNSARNIPTIRSSLQIILLSYSTHYWSLYIFFSTIHIFFCYLSYSFLFLVLYQCYVMCWTMHFSLILRLNHVLIHSIILLFTFSMPYEGTYVNFSISCLFGLAVRYAHVYLN